MITLYKRHATGKIGTWSITAVGNTISMVSQTGPGAKSTQRTEVVPCGKAGRSLEEQIQSRINSRINKKLDNGYKRTLQEAEADAGTNTLGLLKPMLAQRDTSYLAGASSVLVQPKLDGMRLLVTRQNNKVVAYTRAGKLLDTVPHILAQLSPHVHEGQILDGELYCHGERLQTIMSWAKRSQRETGYLNFHMFDVVGDAPFTERFYPVANSIVGAPNVEIVQTVPLKDEGELDSYMAAARSEGYEGLILRNGSMPYEIDKRSKGLIKVKQFLDDEFPVVDVTTGTMGMPVLVCRAKGGTFNVTAPGTHPEKQWALDNPTFFIGHDVTVRHVGLTKDGIPFHPVCLGRRG